ncbi:MAG: LacI family DNA-binding transcriptional regulator [Candidatus Bipolaricaulia bacterium]
MTIKDVAQRAAVSPATVSRVLNGQQHYIRQETRQRVLQAVEELDYTPDRRAQTLRKQKTGIIGVIMPDISNPFFSLLIRGVEREARAQDYSVIICDSENALEGENHAIDTLLRERVDGVIVTSVSAENAHLQSFLHKGFSLVIADRRLAHLEVPAVVVDSFRDGHRLTQHMLGLGYRNIAFIQGPPEVSTAVDRFEGYLGALADHGLSPGHRCCVEQGDYTFEGGYEAAQRLLRYCSPEAIIAANDLMAIGTLYTLKEQGVRVPEEVGVAGFDNIPLASWVHPRLTTIEIPAYKMGQEAMSLLACGLGEEPGLPRTKVLRAKLVKGQSCTAKSVPEESGSKSRKIGSEGGDG